MSDSLNKRFYRIGDVAELMQLPASTLRFWESSIPELKPRRTVGGARMYSPADVERLQIIRYLIKDKGLKLEAAREHFRSNRQAVERTYRVVERLRAMRRKLAELGAALDHRPKTETAAPPDPEE